MHRGATLPKDVENQVHAYRRHRVRDLLAPVTLKMSHDSVQAGDRMMSKSETNERSTGCHIRINGVGHTAAASGTFVRIQRKDGNSLLELSVNVIVQGEPSSDCPGGAEGSALVALNGIPVPADHTVRSVDLTVRMDDHAGVGDRVRGRSDTGQSAADRQIVTSGSLNLTWSPGTVSAPAIKTCAGDHLENYPDMIVELNGDVPRNGYDTGFTGIPIPEPGLSDDMALDAVLFEGRTSIPIPISACACRLSGAWRATSLGTWTGRGW